MIACAKVISYQSGAYRDEDGVGHRKRHLDKVKRDQGAALYR